MEITERRANNKQLLLQMLAQAALHIQRTFEATKIRMQQQGIHHENFSAREDSSRKQSQAYHDMMSAIDEDQFNQSDASRLHHIITQWQNEQLLMLQN